jgi:GNAT superfamily N-acetyltransferase
MFIREARAEDADAMSSVLVASISELCVPDHGRDPAVIARWTANKTPEGIRHWFDNSENRLFVAVEDSGDVLGVGGISTEGEIRVNYVSPGARFRGVTKALTAHMEDALRAMGIDEARLTSTATAHRLYRAAGWVDAGPRGMCFGVVTAQPMTKSLTSKDARRQQ